MSASPEMETDGIETLYELCFRSLLAAGRDLAFPCDALGRVDLDGLSDLERSNYLYARTVVGREVSPPAVQACLAESV